MPNQESRGAQGRPVWMFMAATAMATTVSTLAATAMVKAESTEPVAVTCACELPVAAATPAPPAPPEAPAVEAPAETQDQRVTAPTQTSEPTAEPTAEVVGSLPKDMIRRIVKAHINEVRYCYNQGLAADPELAGRVAVQFVVGPAGGVPISSEVESTTLEDDGEVSECIANAVGRWMFPRPTTEEAVLITYPFLLEPG